MSAATTIVINSPGVFLGIWAATGLPAFVLQTAAARATGLIGRDAVNEAVAQRRYDQLAIVAAIGVVAFLLTQFGVLAAIIAAHDGGQGREPGAGDALERALGRFPAWLWTEFIVMLRILLGLLLFVVPGIIMSIRYGFAQFAVAIEDLSGGAAIARSRALIVPNMGKVVGNLLVFLLVLLAASLGIGFAGGIVQGLVRATAGDIPALAVSAAIQGVTSLLSAWNVAASTSLFAALAARLPAQSR